MTGSEYRIKASQLFEMARREADPSMRQQLEHLALRYVDLAENVDKKVGYRFDHGTPALLQQQQPQRK